MKTQIKNSTSVLVERMLCTAILGLLGFTFSCSLPFFQKDKALSAPVLAVPTQASDLTTILLEWTPVEGAEKYGVLARDVTAGGVFADIGMFEGTSGSWPGWTILGWVTITPGHTYEFKVYAHRRSDGAGTYSQSKSYRVPDFTAPKNPAASSMAGSILVSWDAVETASAYELERRILGPTSSNWELISGYDYTETSYSDSDTWPGVSYEYRVRARSNQWSYPSSTTDFSLKLTIIQGGTFPTPESLNATQGVWDDRIRLSWKEVSEAEEYRVYRLKQGLGDPASTADYSPIAEWEPVESSSGEWNYWDDSAYRSSFEPGVRYFYRVRARRQILEGYYTTDGYIPGVYSESGLSPAAEGWAGTLSGGEDPNPWDDQVWAALGSPTFGSSEGKPSLVLEGSTLYAIFSDAQDPDKRLKAMSHDGGSASGWYDPGDYLSMGTPSGERAGTLAAGGTIYAAYGEPGDGNQLYVKVSTGSAWNPVGLSAGVTVYDELNTIAWSKSGSSPSLVPYEDGLLLVYISDSGSLAGSLAYPGYGDYWEEADSGYWTDNTISGSETALVLDSTGTPVAALQSGVGVQFHQYHGGSWTSRLAPFDPGNSSDQLELRGFIIDSLNTPYLAWETLSYGSPPLRQSDICRWNGSAWESFGFMEAIETPLHVMDLSILEHPGGTGILAAAACSDGSTYWIGLWAYDGSGWLQAGPLLEDLAGVTSVTLAVDAQSRPVLAYATGGDKALTAVRLVSP